MEILFYFLFVLIILYLAFLPSKIALSKKSKHRKKIFFINLFFGWTLPSWFILLIWAINDTKENDV